MPTWVSRSTAVCFARPTLGKFGTLFSSIWNACRTSSTNWQFSEEFSNATAIQQFWNGEFRIKLHQTWIFSTWSSLVKLVLILFAAFWNRLVRRRPERTLSLRFYSRLSTMSLVDGQVLTFWRRLTAGKLIHRTLYIQLELPSTFIVVFIILTFFDFGDIFQETSANLLTFRYQRLRRLFAHWSRSAAG